MRPGSVGNRDLMLRGRTWVTPRYDALRAQAIYVHAESEDASFALSPFTYDADIALDPGTIGQQPHDSGGHEPRGLPSWRTNRDCTRGAPGRRLTCWCLGPLAGPGRRAARLGVHGNRAATKVHGLEGALVSHAHRKITSLTADADRSCILKVAGPAALLVSKVHKVGERLEDPDVRRRDALAKDAFDIYRLLRAIDTAELASELDLLGSHPGIETCDFRRVVHVSAPVQYRVRHGHRARAQGGPGSRGPRLHL